MVWFLSFMLLFLLGCVTQAIMMAVVCYQNDDNVGLRVMAGTVAICLFGLALNLDALMRI